MCFSIFFFIFCTLFLSLMEVSFLSIANDISGVFTPMFVPSSASAVGSSIGSAFTAPFSPGGAAQMNAQKSPGILELVFGSSADSQKTPTVQPSNGGGFFGNVSSPAVDYLNADLAKHYGLGTATAYQEALDNTAIQRRVADLKAAGLNPVLALGSVGGASTASAGLSGYGSSGGYGSSASSVKSNDFSFRSLLHNGNMQSAAAALASAATMAATKNFQLSASVYFGAKAGLQALDSVLKK